MNAALFAYSRRGCATARRVMAALADWDIQPYTMERFAEDGFAPLGRPAKEFYGPIFGDVQAMIFVSSVGLAVREVAPHLKSKATDPAVLVLDELGQYVIPVLSGHIGGANELAKALAASLGAQAVNKALRDALPMLTGTFDVAHICGKGNLDPTLDKTPGYTQVEFLDKELPDVLAAADLVLSRAGSNALMEFQALARPLLLVPYPKGASRGDQILNAQSLEKRGLCHVLLQENMTPQTLTDALMQTWAERDKLTAAVKNAPPADGTKRVLEMIEEVQTRKA